MFFFVLLEKRLTSLSVSHTDFLVCHLSIYLLLDFHPRNGKKNFVFSVVCIGKKLKANCTLITMDRCFVFCLQDNIILFVVFFAVCWSASHIERVNFWKFSPYTHLHNNWKALFFQKKFLIAKHTHTIFTFQTFTKICLFVCCKLFIWLTRNNDLVVHIFSQNLSFINNVLLETFTGKISGNLI